MNQPADPQRLSKAVAALLPCSRREAEDYITQGRVRVDGNVVLEPQARVAPGQAVTVDAAAPLQPAALATFLLHKPAGLSLRQAQALLTADRRWEGDADGERLQKSHMAGLQSPLPLPDPAEGLEVFSQDGRILRKLREDGRMLEQELVAMVAGKAGPQALQRMGSGLEWRGQPLPHARVSWQSDDRLRIAAKGLPLECLPWLCAQAGLELRALRRIRMGRVPMAGLPPGQWRLLAPGEAF